MLILLSPSKTQDFENKPLITDAKTPRFLSETSELSEVMKEFSAEDLAKLMKTSEKISDLNFERFQDWNNKFSLDREHTKQAIFAFKGDVYRGFDLESWQQADYNFAEKSLRIISGFYGILTPKTLMKPYRLEMGTQLSFDEHKNLYEFWREKLTHSLAEDFETTKARFILNLASVEYAKAINLAKFGDKVCNVDFKVLKNGEYKTIGIFAKRQRGEMSNWIIKNKIEKQSDLLAYSGSGFNYAKDLSVKNHLVFTKE